MIKTKPPRYQTLIERSIIARGFGTEKYYVIDSRTNARIVKCRNQQESEKIAGWLKCCGKISLGKAPSRLKRLPRRAVLTTQPRK